MGTREEKVDWKVVIEVWDNSSGELIYRDWHDIKTHVVTGDKLEIKSILDIKVGE